MNPKDFYTITLKDSNPAVPQHVVRKFRAYTKDGRFLPNAFCVCPGFPKKNIKRIGVALPFMYTGTPTDEQSHILDRIIKRARQDKYFSGLINMKTGRGKSHMIMQIIDFYRVPTLILVHNQKTLQEMEDKIKEFTAYDPGVYYSAKKNIKNITITTHTSFVKSQGLFPNQPQLILYDECDRGSGSPKMIEALCNAGDNGCDLLYGLTGTPYRDAFSTEDMEKIFGKIIQFEDQENDGYNIIPEINTIKYYGDTRYLFENWHEARDQFMLDETRQLHQKETILKFFQGHNVSLLLTERVEEAGIYFNNLQGDDFETILITGKTSIDQDKVSLEKAFSEKKRVLIIGTSGKMSRGIDIPQIDSIFLFYPAHFKGTVIQAVGRALRKYEGKNRVVVYDWNDLPLLYKQAYDRKKSYKQEYGEDVKIENILTIKVKDLKKEENTSLPL